MAFPDIVSSLKVSLPDLRGRLLANEPLAPSPGFASAGRRRRCSCRRTRPISPICWRICRATFPSRSIGLGSNLIVRDGGVAGRRDPARARLQRDQDRAGQSRARRHGGARSARRESRAGGRHRGPRVPARHSGRDRRRAAHERRRLWARDQGRSDRSARRRSRGQRPHLYECRHGIHLSSLRRARGCRVHPGAVSKARRAIPPRSPPRWTRSPRRARRRSR